MVKGCLFWVCGMFSIRGTSVGNILPPSLFCLNRYQCVYIPAWLQLQVGMKTIPSGLFFFCQFPTSFFLKR